MKLAIQGKGSVILTNNDYLSSGGMGQIFVKGDTAYKIYIDPKKMIPVAKIQELAVITNPNVIKPEDVLLDSGNRSTGFVPVGYTMKYVKDTYSLCQLFTKSFKERNKVSPDMSLKLIRKLQEMITHIHEKDILIVDLNELNFLCSKDFTQLFCIDTDSYQTRSFPATAIMDSIRDRHNKTFSKVTDWFSFAILAFQTLIGIHPYKGKCDKYKNIDERMDHNISVLNKQVRVPAACYPFNIIPKAYLDWFSAVLDGGQRIPPPLDLNSVITLVQTIQKVVGSDNFEIKEFASFPDTIEDIFFINNLQIVLTHKSLCWNKMINPHPWGDTILTTIKNNTVVSVGWKRGNKLILNNETANSNIDFELEGSGHTVYDNRLYVKSGTHILQIQLMDIGHKDVLASSSVVANVLESATTAYDGVFIQNMLGTYFASVFPASGTHQLIKLMPLSGYQILSAKYDKRVLMVEAVKNGKYDRFIFRLKNDDYDCEYDTRIIKDIAHTGLNFVVLDNGFCVSITEEDNLEIFSAKMNSTYQKIIDDPVINSEMKLYKNGTKLYFKTMVDHNKIFSISMKKTK